MKLGEYPVIEDNIFVSEVVTPHRVDRLIYDTVTRGKRHPNEAVFSFLKLATGKLTFKEIIDELAKKADESPHDIWPKLSDLADYMVKEGLLRILTHPVDTPRIIPPSVHLVHRLENVSLEVTTLCNLKCGHCYADAGKKRPDELTTKEIKHAIDLLWETGVLAITFTGGEPLLHPDIFELMEYARNKPMTVVLFTNGTLITPAVVEKLKKLQVYRVNISIDGPDADTHDKFRGVPGSFNKTITGIKLLKKAQIPIHASTSLTKPVYKRVKDVLQLLKGLGITDSKIWPPTFSGRSNYEDVFITIDEFREAMEDMHAFEYGQTHQKQEFKYSKSLENCGVGWSALVIKSNGVVTPCPSFDIEFSLGNIKTDSIHDIWNNSELLNKLRKLSVYKTEECKTCEFAAMCKGGCIADVYMRRGEFSCYDPYMCVAFEVSKNDFIPVEVDDTVKECAIHFQSFGD
ncbi:MAG: radical SAM protein [Candidatus Methanofastidiosia archaeon]|jgi:radical SAM protein with 4Fe4S-binding SPASM domain